MDIRDLKVEVRNEHLQRVGVVDLRDAQMTLEPVFNNVGKWELILPIEHRMTSHLRMPGSGIRVFGPGGVFISGPTTYFGSKASKEQPEGLVTFQGITDDHHLRDRLAYPVPSSDTMAGQAGAPNDVRTGPVETVIHGYVNANIGPAAPASRRIPRLTMGANLGRGPSVRKTARFPILGNVLAELAPLGLLGFRIRQAGTALQFETFQMQDKRKTIRMSLRNNTLASYEVERAAPVATRVIVGGQEEGVKRQLVERTSEESLSEESLWGRRIETFLDQRQTEVITELEQAGDELLAKDGIRQEGVKFTPMDDYTMRFLHDWNLGDIVTAVVEGREVAAVVTSAIIKVDNQGIRVACALGDQSSTGNAINSVEARLSNLERNAEGGGGTRQTLRLTSTASTAPTSTEHALQIGPDSGQNLIADTNDLMARNNGQLANLFLNALDVRLGPTSGDQVYTGPSHFSSVVTKAYVDTNFVKDAGEGGSRIGGTYPIGLFLRPANIDSRDDSGAAVHLNINPSGGNVSIGNGSATGSSTSLDSRSVRIGGNNAIDSFTVRAPFVQFSGITTNTLSGSVYMNSVGQFYRSTSTRDSKVSIEDAPVDWAEKVYGLQPRTWFDRVQSEAWAAHEDAVANGEEPPEIDPDPLLRVPGFVAEEVETAGLTDFVTRDGDGALTGVAYDRISAALVMTIKAQKAQIDAQTQQIADITARLSALENGATE